MDLNYISSGKTMKPSMKVTTCPRRAATGGMSLGGEKFFDPVWGYTVCSLYSDLFGFMTLVVYEHFGMGYILQ